MHICLKAFAPYVILEKKNTIQGTHNQFLIKKHIEQQAESAVDADDPQPSMPMM